MRRSRSSLRHTAAVLLLILSRSGLHASDPAAAAAADGGSENATWEEQVAVVVEAAGVAPPLGSSSTTLDPTELGGDTGTLTAVLAELAGVSQNGQGGHFQVFSIRGISRHRVVSQVAGMRVHSERRAGASVSFVDPLLLGSVSVLRGPATALHGSGALGGVVQLFPRAFEGWSLRAGYDSQGDENYQVFGYGSAGWSVGFARRDAANAETPDGTQLNSHFTQYSATLQRTWGNGPRTYELLYVPTLGQRIGKDNTDFPVRTTEYPRERHQMLEFLVAADSGWRVRAHLHGHDLETEVERAGSLSRVFNESLDYGARWERESRVGEPLVLTYGLEASGRHGVDAEETDETGSRKTLDDAQEIETGGFLTARWERAKTGVEAGARVTWLQQKNTGAPTEDGSALSGFAGIVQRVGARWELRASLSSGLRFPNLSERFFSGTTGAGQIAGNPDLDRERSLSGELSARWLGRKLLVDAALFHNEIDDYIERVKVEGMPGQFELVNLPSGTLRGIELQGQFRPTELWTVSFGGQVMEGRDEADLPLADVPADEVYLELRFRPGPWSYEARLTARAEKTDVSEVGGETAIPSAELLRVSVGRRLAGAWSLSLSGSNLLDETYFASADDKASPATGRSVGVHLVRSGG